MILVFAGAGASKATNPDLYPTTREYYEKLSGDVKNDEIFKSVENYLFKSKPQDNAIVDIEEILWALDDLILLSTQTVNQNNLIGTILSNDKFVKLAIQEKPLVVQNFFRNISHKAGELVKKINVHVYDLYSKLPAQDNLEIGWIPLLDKLLQREERIEIFSTNYDQVIESAIEIISSDSKMPKIKTGRLLTVQPHLDLGIWENSASELEQNNGGIFTKLHGSIDWSKSGNTIYVGNPLYSGDQNRHVIIYPGFKDRDSAIFEKPFNLFHEHFKSVVSKAGIFVFIGFAFRDSAIKKILETQMSPNAKVYVIDPKPNHSLVNFPTSKITPIPYGFNLEALNELFINF